MTTRPVVRIPLSKGQFAEVDEADAATLLQWKWQAHVTSTGVMYARRDVVVDGKRLCIIMHREILNAPAGMVVDHIDGDGLNNRRENLRICTHAQNMRNRVAGPLGKHPYLGVGPVRKTDRWRARLANRHLGVFATAEEARDAYLAAAIERDPDFYPRNLSKQLTPERLAKANSLPRQKRGQRAR